MSNDLSKSGDSVKKLKLFRHIGRADDVIIHLRLRDDGKVLIEYDGIEYGVAQDLVEAGIAPEDILFNMYATPRPLKEAIAA